jgi:hypothetical protein
MPDPENQDPWATDATPWYGNLQHVDPHDDPEKQKLEEQLWYDERMQQQAHETLEAERHFHDVAQEEHPTQLTDARIEHLEGAEQKYAAQVVADQQALQHWDHDHPLSPETRGLEQAADAVYDAAGQLIHGVTGAQVPEFSAEHVADQAWGAAEAQQADEGYTDQPSG